MMNCNYEIAVIGAGPAGMIAASEAAGMGAKVIVLEKNNRAGRKLAITGKGRCNVTNASDLREMQEQMISNPRFILSSFHQFNNQDVMDLFEGLGVPLKVERGNRVFPVSDKAQDIVQALVQRCQDYGVRIQYNTKVSEVSKEQDGWRVKTGDAEYCVRKLIIATGGKSYPATGSTGDGYIWARQLQHEIVDPRQGLVPLTTAESWVKELQGVSLRNVGIEVYHKETLICKDFGEMMFTHFGVTGPVILSASSRIQQYVRSRNIAYREITLHIDLKPALTPDVLDKRILRDFEKYSRKQIQGAIADMLPAKMIPVIAELSGIPAETRALSVTREQRHILLQLLKDLKCTITGCRSMAEAIITMGGVAVSQIQPRTMESKVHKGLYWAGEVLDVDALTGGYNLQIAFSTGAAAGRAAADSVMQENWF